ncbi:DUF1788 domain-containing protein [Candidatus Nomurabacteria bacterium]|nr:DUF1788 domain-containing protein [Candidatus Nomurabacteria bacterium]
MLSTTEKLNLMVERLSDKSFLKSEKLSNELPFYIFDYKPEEELVVRYKTKQIIDELKINKNIKVAEFNLYQILIEHLEKKKVLDKVPNMELEQGFENLIENMAPLLNPKIYIDQIKESVAKVDIIFLTGVGSVWPFLRSHSVLNNLHPIVDNIPLVMFYPGKWDKTSLNLFNKFKDDNYYRAFSLFES